MLVCATVGFAQIDIEQVRILDLAEDTTQVNTIADIIQIQEQVSKNNTKNSHFADVWSRRSFINIGYDLSTKMTAKHAIQLGYNDRTADKFKSSQGVMLQFGHAYALHRSPIANIVQFNIDYTYVDLDFNYFKAEQFANEFDPKTNKNLPWAAKKYSLSYGMTLGPSVTVAPLTILENSQLHYFKLNLYYHFGYHAGILLMDQKTSSDKAVSFDNVVWGHGISQSFGLSLSWKTIGIGWESRFSAKPRFKSISGNNQKGSFRFDNSSSRIYLTIRY